MRFTFLVLTITAAIAALWGDLRAQSRLDLKVDGSAGYNQDRMAFFPTGNGKLYLTVVTGDDWQTDARTQQVRSWFRTDRRLIDARQNTWWNWYTTSNPHFKERLRARLGDAVPIVALQKPDGQVLLNVTAKSMPQSAGALADMLDDAMQAHYAPPQMGHVLGYETPIEYEDCPDCGPDQPDFDPDSSLPPADVIDEVLPPSRTSWLGTWAAIAAVAGVVGVFAVVLAIVTTRQPPRVVPGPQLPTF